MTMEREECKECDGTGSTEPDCWLCKGQRYIHVKLAYRHRYKKVDLPDIDGDFCYCPECCDEASTCDFCDGDGVVDSFIAGQQEMRLLIYGLTRSIPRQFYRDQTGAIRLHPDEILLSRTAASECRDKKLVNWFCSVLGDEINLTAKGEDAARDAWKQYRTLWREWVTAERARRNARAKWIIARGNTPETPAP